jgi:hypothetical protein
VYRIIPDAAVFEQVAALPDEALESYADVLGVLALTPWNGSPQHKSNPDGALRRWTFGPGHAGQVVYLVLEDQQEVHIVLVQWFG